MRNVIVGLGIIVFVVGAVWTGQGAGVIPGSFMTGQTFWLLVGIGCLLVGAVLVVVGARRRRPANRRP